MAKGVSRKDRKEEYFSKVHQLCKDYKKVIAVNVDNVTSSQLHQIRAAMRGRAILCMGKNTLIRKAVREIIEELPQYEALLPLIRGNCGLVFTNDSLSEVRDIITANRIAAPAKTGAIVQCDVTIPAGNTGIEPGKTSFFQALEIATKVVKGTIEILSPVLIMVKGDKVSASQAELLSMLNITPFSYGLTLLQIFDEGSVYEPSVLDITDDMILSTLKSAVRNIAAVSLATGFTTAASVPHLVVNGFKNVLSVALSTEYSFPAADAVKEMLANPGAFVAAPAAASATEAAAPAVEEEAEESDEDMGFGLFD